ncbi:MAG: hypothetical protein WC703_07645 [Candidatus Neomarinimicrobiota bacterium]
MQFIRINLLGNTAIRKKQKRIRFSVTALYVVVWIFSLSTLFYVYRTNLFISSVYQKEIRKISAEVGVLNPKLERIRQLYQNKEELTTKTNIYLQQQNRPSVWLSKMIALSNMMPANIRLEEISVETAPAKGKQKEQIRLTGYTVIDSRKPDINQLNIFKKTLEQSESFMNGFQRVDIFESRIGKKGTTPIMSFVIGIS